MVVGLGQIIVGSGFESSNQVVLGTVGGEQQEVNVSEGLKLFELPNGPTQLQAGHARHVPIGDHNAAAAGPDGGERGASVRERLDGVSRTDQLPFQQLPRRGIIVHHEHPRLFGRGFSGERDW